MSCRGHFVYGVFLCSSTQDLCTDFTGQVYPAAGYAAEVQEQGGKVAVFNLDRSQGDEEADFLFLGGCEQTLPQALGLAKITATAGA